MVDHIVGSQHVDQDNPVACMDPSGILRPLDGDHPSFATKRNRNVKNMHVKRPETTQIHIIG